MRVRDEIVYWVLFESVNSKHDKNQKFNNDDIVSFFDWLQEQRIIVEKEIGKPVVIANCGRVSWIRSN